jgi:hypothetical protein
VARGDANGSELDVGHLRLLHLKGVEPFELDELGETSGIGGGRHDIRVSKIPDGRLGTTCGSRELETHVVQLGLCVEEPLQPLTPNLLPATCVVLGSFLGVVGRFLSGCGREKEHGQKTKHVQLPPRARYCLFSKVLSIVSLTFLSIFAIILAIVPP